MVGSLSHIYHQVGVQGVGFISKSASDPCHLSQTRVPFVSGFSDRSCLLLSQNTGCVQTVGIGGGLRVRGDVF